MTKTYVAALVLRLVDDCVLALDDTIERWLPGLVDSGDAINIELLLRMRSGLPDYAGPLLGDPPNLSVLQSYWSPQALVQLALSSIDRIAPDPGHRYCNTDYVLLGLIVESATGERIDAQLWQKIFQPVALGDTTFPTVDPHVRHAPRADVRDTVHHCGRNHLAAPCAGGSAEPPVGSRAH